MDEMTNTKRNYNLIKIGLKVNRLSFGGLIKSGKKTLSKWTCECGNKIVVRPISVFIQNTKSCGCLQREKIGNMRRTHGKTNLPEYKIWKGMKNRCYNKNNSEYKNYGNRGITVCERWHNFENFVQDMPGFKPGLSIERIDVNLGYCPENCTWIEHRLQGRNTRLVKMSAKSAKEVLSMREKGFTYRQIADHFKVGKSCVSHIINKRSWNE